MKRNLKALGLALFAVLALGAIAAQAAMAVDHEFNAEAEPAIITGEADPNAPLQVFTPTTADSGIECKALHADGTQVESPADEIEVIPQYSECNKFLGIFTVKVTNVGNTKLSNDANATTGGCKYVFDSDTSNNSFTGIEDAPVSIECEEGKAIVIDVEGACTIKVSGTGNTGLHGVKYNNVQTSGKAKEVTLEAKVHDVHYTSEGPFCGLGGVEATGKALYEGNATVRAFEDPGDGTTGAQVNAFMTT